MRSALPHTLVCGGLTQVKDSGRPMRHTPTIMVGRFNQGLRVEAQLCGKGPRPWAWAIYGANPWIAIERSEAMFPSPEAAKRVGTLVAAQLELGSKERRPSLH